MSSAFESQRLMSGQGPVERLVKVYRQQTHRYPLAEALCEHSPKSNVFIAMMNRDLSRLEARLRDPTDDEVEPYGKTFYILMTPDENGESFHVGGLNIYVEKIVKLGTGLEGCWEAFNKSTDEEYVMRVGGKTTAEDVALHWGMPETSALRTQLVRKLMQSQPLDFPQLRSFEASKLFEIASTAGTLHVDALSRDHHLRKLWEAYRLAKFCTNSSSRYLVTGESHTRTLLSAGDASRVLDAAESCKKYLKQKNRAWLKTGIEAMLNESARDILVTKEEGAMLLELNRAVRDSNIAISRRIVVERGLLRDDNDKGREYRKTPASNAQSGDKEMGPPVRKPRHRWLRRMGISLKEETRDPSPITREGRQWITRLPSVPRLHRSEAFSEQRCRGQSHCGLIGHDDLWTPFLSD